MRRLLLLLFTISPNLCDVSLRFDPADPLQLGESIVISGTAGEASGNDPEPNTFRISLWDKQEYNCYAHLIYYIKTDPIAQDQAVQCATRRNEVWSQISYSRRESIASGTTFTLILRLRKESIEIFQDAVYKPELSTCFVGSDTIQAILAGNHMTISHKITVAGVKYRKGFDTLPAVSKLRADFQGAYIQFTVYIRHDYALHPWLTADFVDQSGVKILQLKFNVRNNTVTELSSIAANDEYPLNRQKIIIKETFVKSQISSFKLHYEKGPTLHGFYVDGHTQTKWEIPHNNGNLVDVQLNSEGIDVHELDVDNSHG